MDTPEIDGELDKVGEKTPPKTFDVVAEEQVSGLKAAASRWGIDTSKLQIIMTKPGEEIFDREEIQHKLLTQKCSSDWDKFIKQYGFIDQVPIDQLREAMVGEGVILDGSLPGFAMTKDGEGEIIFFAVLGKNLVEMAKKYAQKSGQTREFKTPDEALRYLTREQAEVGLAHEFGHIRYQEMKTREPQSLEVFDRFVQSQPALQERVRVLQADKFDDPQKIPMSILVEEAYADMFAGEFLTDVRGQERESRVNVGFKDL